MTRKSEQVTSNKKQSQLVMFPGLPGYTPSTNDSFGAFRDESRAANHSLQLAAGRTTGYNNLPTYFPMVPGMMPGAVPGMMPGTMPSMMMPGQYPMGGYPPGYPMPQMQMGMPMMGMGGMSMQMPGANPYYPGMQAPGYPMMYPQQPMMIGVAPAYNRPGGDIPVSAGVAPGQAFAPPAV